MWGNWFEISSLKPVHTTEFLDMLENYFEQPDELKLRDARPEYHYQVWSRNLAAFVARVPDLIGS